MPAEKSQFESIIAPGNFSCKLRTVGAQCLEAELRQKWVAGGYQNKFGVTPRSFPRTPIASAQMLWATVRCFKFEGNLVLRGEKSREANGAATDGVERSKKSHATPTDPMHRRRSS